LGQRSACSRVDVADFEIDRQRACAVCATAPDPLNATDEITKANTNSPIVIARMREGVSHDM
jgi:hypothetical protein